MEWGLLLQYYDWVDFLSAQRVDGMVEEEAEEEKEKKSHARKSYVAVGLGSVVVIAVGVFSFLYPYPLVWQRDFADNNGVPKSNLRIALITDANFSDKQYSPSPWR